MAIGWRVMGMSGGSPGDRLSRSWVCRVVLRYGDRFNGEVMGMAGGCHGDRSVRSWVCRVVVMAIGR